MSKTAEAWNSKYRVGTTVRFFPIPGNKEKFIETETRGAAWTLSSGKAIVALKNVQGSKSLEQVEALPSASEGDEPYARVTQSPPPYPASSPWSGV